MVCKLYLSKAVKKNHSSGYKDPSTSKQNKQI